MRRGFQRHEDLSLQLGCLPPSLLTTCAAPSQPVQCSLHPDRTLAPRGRGAAPPGSGAPPPSAASRSRAPPPTLLRATRLDRPWRRLLQGKVVLSEADLLGCFELPTASAGQLVGNALHAA